MDETDRTFLRRNQVLFVRGILRPDKVAILLKQKNMISDFAVQTVCAQPTQIQGAQKLMSLVPRYGPEIFDVFMSILETLYPNLVMELELMECY